MTEQELKWEYEKFEMKKKSYELSLEILEQLNKIRETCRMGQEILKGVE